MVLDLANDNKPKGNCSDRNSNAELIWKYFNIEIYFNIENI